MDGPREDDGRGQQAIRAPERIVPQISTIVLFCPRTSIDKG
jgi:hypothetical protein